MDTLYGILILVALALCVVFLLKLLAAPIKLIFKLLLNAALGFVILFIVNFLGGFIGISIGMTLINALVVGIFGVPGVAVLIVLALLL